MTSLIAAVTEPMTTSDYLIAIIVFTLAAIAGLTLLGMTFMMTVDAFGIGIALGYVGGMVAVGLALWGAPAPTILVLMLVAGATLVGVAVPLMIGAIIGRRSLITSWPPQQEQTFQTFEARAASSHGTAMMIGIGAAAAAFVFAVAVKFGIEAPKSKIGDTMNMENLSNKK
jgi:hypothetical protein